MPKINRLTPSTSSESSNTVSVMAAVPSKQNSAICRVRPKNLDSQGTRG
ncbi:Uncharacterised protein [Vibrio cholerae]|nr:Uncharacterised protein [Vibrio cholerae]